MLAEEDFPSTNWGFNVRVVLELDAEDVVPT